METVGISEDEIPVLYIAGGFGSHLNVDSAMAIGLIPPSMKKHIQVLGNAALSGAAELLLNQDRLETVKALASTASHLNLDGNPQFNENFCEQILFSEMDL